MGFLPDVRKIVRKLPTKRQTLLFSATMPEDIRQLAQEVLQNPLTIRIDDTVPLATVSHALYPVEPHRKTALLMKLLDRTDTESVLVFTRTKHRATRLAQQIQKAGYPAASLQGDLPQNKRQAALNGFRDGKYRILVATDIAARGIDVSGISHVINYDMPDTADAYTHRIGRTGRAAKTGDAFTFVTREDRAFVWTIEKALGEAIERRTLEDFDYTTPPPAGSGFDRLRKTGGGAAMHRTVDSMPAMAAAASPWGGSRDFSRKATKIFSSSNLRSRRSRGGR